MNYLEFLQTLKKDLIRSNIEFETVKFFRKDIVSVWIGSLATERLYSFVNLVCSINVILKIQPSWSSCGRHY